MNGLPYYPRYPRDFFDGTIGLSFEVKGAYAMLLDLIYMSGGQLYDDARFIAGHMNCSVRAWNQYRLTLIERRKIKVENGIISNLRADKELIIQRSFQDKQRENRLGSRKNNDLAITVVEPKHNHTDTDTDKKKREANASPKDAGLDLFDAFWQAYPQKGRTGKKSAQDKFRNAIKSGVDPQRMIIAATAYCRSENVLRGYAKNCITWLNQGCWDDETQLAPQNETSDFWVGNKVWS